MELVPPTNSMNKAAVIQKILEALQSELETYVRAAKFSHAEATAEENRAENKYDTRGLEASYLAAGQANKVMELESAIEAFENLQDQTTTGAIEIGSLVELEQDDFVELYLIGPTAGGTEVVLNEKEVLVITQESPLGSQLMDQETGDQLTLELGGRQQKATVLSVK